MSRNSLKNGVDATLVVYALTGHQCVHKNKQ